MVQVFQSSPGTQAGCYQWPESSRVEQRRFNPHPAHRPGATYRQDTAPETLPGFNPHPAHRPGATGFSWMDGSLFGSFNPHPAHRPGATHNRKCEQRGYVVSILTRHTGRVLPEPKRALFRASAVSILTRHTGRVLLLTGLSRIHSTQVSILTRHTGRVLPITAVEGITLTTFQSSPGTQAGCYPGVFSNIQYPCSFNPHPAHRPGATGFAYPSNNGFFVSILTRHTGRVLRWDVGNTAMDAVFQSSPGTQAGCYVTFKEAESDE